MVFWSDSTGALRTPRLLETPALSQMPLFDYVFYFVLHLPDLPDFPKCSEAASPKTQYLSYVTAVLKYVHVCDGFPSTPIGSLAFSASLKASHILIQFSFCPKPDRL